MITLFLILTTFSSIITMSYSKSITLTPTNFDQSTEKGQPILIKFCSKSCTKCNEIKAAWEVLQEEYESNSNLIIGDIDCDEYSAFCEDYDIVGTPTILYGHRLDLNEYGGDVSFAKLKQFTKDYLLDVSNKGGFCTPDNVDVCSDKDKKLIESLMKMSMEELEEMTRNMKNDEERGEIDFQLEMDKLQTIYDDINNSHVLNQAAIKRQINLLNNIMDHGY